MSATETRAERLLRWRAGETAGPWSISLYPTIRCNFHCPICWQRNPDFKLEFHNELPDERYLSLVDEAAEAGVREWSIMGGGEPLIRGDLVIALCERIKSNGMSGYVQTNGSLFTPAQLLRLVDARFDAVRVSVDGPTAEINDTIRNAGSFERATANLKMLADFRRKTRAKFPIVSIYMVITSLAYDKLDRMVEYAASVGASSIEANMMVLFSEAARPFQLDERQKADLPAHLDRAIHRAKQLGIRTNFDLFYAEEIVQDPNSMRPLETPTAQEFCELPCFQPWLDMVILHNGSAGPCCIYDFECTRDDNNVGKRPLMEVWMGPYFRKLRSDVPAGRLPGYCRTCPSILYAKQAVLRTEMHTYLAPDPVGGRPSAMAKKAVACLWKYGARGAVRRGLEWREIQRRKQADVDSS